MTEPLPAAAGQYAGWKTPPAATLLTLSVANDDEQRLIASSLDRLVAANVANTEAQDYYDGSRIVRDFGISTPPSMQNLRAVAGWPGTVVDVLEERLDWLGWSSDNDYGLDEIYTANDLDVESGMAHLDSLIFGLSFVAVGSGEDGEPSPLVTPWSPLSATGVWDKRARRLSSAISVLMEDGEPAEVTLYQPDETVTFENINDMWRTVDRDPHNLGRVPVVLVPNRSRGSRQIGRSEITRPVRYYTEAAGRTLKGLEANREFYTVPKLIGLNIAEEMFQNPDGTTASRWSAIQGRALMVPPSDDPDAPTPDVKQLTGASPAPYMDQIKGYAVLLSAEAGIPTAYLGFPTDSASSADAIRAGEARLVKRAERRQTTFGRAWREVAHLALLIRDGEVPDDFNTTVTSRWRDAATPTKAATSDAGAKQLGAVSWLSETDVALELIGLDEQQAKRAISQKDSAQRARAMRAPTQPTPQPPVAGSADAGADSVETP